MSTPEIHSFEDFWPHYVRAHRNPYNRALHYVGTSCAVGCVAAGVATLNPWWFVAAPIVGYGPAWIGHYLIEGNRPATFGHPVYSLRGDFKMLGLALRGQMAAEVDRHAVTADTAPAPTEAASRQA